MNSFPVGFRFAPRDAELLGTYLKKKVMNEPLPWNGIVEKDLYGDKSPWELFNDNDIAWQSIGDDDDDNDDGKTKKQHFYCFTRLKKVSKKNAGSSKKSVRSCGCGVWHGQTGALHKIEEGSMKMFKFKLKARTGSVEGRVDDEQYAWLMREYSLSDKVLEEIGIGGTDLVICRVTRVEEKGAFKKQDNHHHHLDNVVVQGGGLGGVLGGQITGATDGQINNEVQGEGELFLTEAEWLELTYPQEYFGTW